jgi:outer membrane murein-binding lipoprotein Lpp
MRSPLTIALFHPLNAAMFVMAALAGLTAAWWLLPLGLAFWIVMVARIANDRFIRTDYDMQARSGTLSPRFQQRYSQVVHSQMRIFNSLVSAGGSTKRALEPVQAEIQTLTNRVYGLCRQMTGPENYVKVSNSNTDWKGERALLTLSLDGVTDPMVKKEKEEALRTLDERMKKINQVSTLLDRVDAQLDSLATSMDSILADIVRLQAMGGAQAEKEAPEIIRQIRAQAKQMETFGEEAAKIA